MSTPQIDSGRRGSNRADMKMAGALLAPATAVVVLMMLAPLMLLLRISLNRFDSTHLMVEAFSLTNYLKFFADRYYFEVLFTTVLVALLTTVACIIFALPIAYGLARMRSRWKSLCILAIVLPLFVGSTVRSVGWMLLFSKAGMLNFIVGLLGLGDITLMYTPFGVVIGIISVNLPFIILTLQSVMEGIEGDLEQAAQSLGASPWTAFWRIVWPIALPGITIAAILSFILAMNAFATPLLIGGPRFHMMAPLLYWEFASNNNWPMAAMLALVLMSTTLAMAALSNKLVRRSNNG